MASRTASAPADRHDLRDALRHPGQQGRGTDRRIASSENRIFSDAGVHHVDRFRLAFSSVTSEGMMTKPVGNTQANDAFGVTYARIMALAQLAATPAVIGRLIFQKRATETAMISAGVKE